MPGYAGGIDLDLPLDELLRQTDDNLAKGFRAIKMKVGRARLAEDVERVERDARASRGRLPAHGRRQHEMERRRGDPRRAGLPALRPHLAGGADHPDDPAGHARIVREGGLPIAAGENLRTLWEFKHYIAGGGVTYPEPDVTNCGGVTAFMKIAHLAEAFNLPVTTHGAHDVTVHLLAACPNRSYLEAHGFGLERYIADPLRIEDGFALAPDRPGHGIAFDWQGLDRIRA